MEQSNANSELVQQLVQMLQGSLNQDASIRQQAEAYII
jgi:hypothetical protein